MRYHNSTKWMAVDEKKLTVRGLFQYLVVGALSLAALPVDAEEALAVPANGDTSVNLWVDRAPLELFIAELAATIGLEVDIEAPLEGQVSGVFNGRLSDALLAVGEQHLLLFDVDEQVLGALPESARSNASVALVNVDLDDSAALALFDNLLPGNTVDLRDDMITVSGHPSFVRRAARFVTTEVSLAEQAQPKFTLDLSLDLVGDEEAQTDVAIVDDADVEIADVGITGVDTEVDVIDVAAQIMLEDPTEPDLGVQQAQQEQSTSRKIEWVTDIPGFNTF